MQAFIEFTSSVIPLAMKDVDTDMIIPAQYLTQINRDGYGKYLFKNLKMMDPNFVFNEKQYQNSQILLAQTNFGCGSSREHAVWALMQAGIKTIIAESFSDIFFNNAQKNGLLLITLNKPDIVTLFSQSQNQLLMLAINLQQQTIRSNDKIFHFDYDPFRKTCLVNGYDDLDYLLNAMDNIKTFKNARTI